MSKIIIDKNNYKDYRQFYEDIVIKLDAKNDLNCLDPDNLSYNSNHLDELLWDCHQDGNTYIFKNFDLEKIEHYKSANDYEWGIIFKVFRRFVKEFPNNKLEFVNDEKLQ